MESRTITRTLRRRTAKGGRKPHLFLVLRCDDPLDTGARVCLEAADTVVLGRGQRQKVERSTMEGAATLRIEMPDRHMSATHARLQRVLGEWMIEDAGSKNGTLVDGRRISRGPLGDGALLELGHTFLLFREAIPAAGPDCVTGRELPSTLPGLQTLSPDFAAELEKAALVARSRVSLLVSGETGTGKEVVASAIHQVSGRPGPFQAVNCGAFPPNLVESELFGYRKGAFSGAMEDRPGLVRSAEGGTLFLDEIGDLPLQAQAALLRVLQEEEVTPIGGTRPVEVDFRLVAATHRDLDALVSEEKFRPDLLARISGHTLSLPPLRERREDLGLLIAALLERIAGPLANAVAQTADAARALLLHRWPLNVRELEKCLGSALVLAAGARIDVDHLPPAVRAREAPPPSPPAAAPALGEEDRKRREELIAQLRTHAGNVTAVARAMGKARTQVQRWLRRYRLDPLSFRP